MSVSSAMAVPLNFSHLSSPHLNVFFCQCELSTFTFYFSTSLFNNWPCRTPGREYGATVARLHKTCLRCGARALAGTCASLSSVRKVAPQNTSFRYHGSQSFYYRQRCASGGPGLPG